MENLGRKQICGGAAAFSAKWRARGTECKKCNTVARETQTLTPITTQARSLRL